MSRTVIEISLVGQVVLTAIPVGAQILSAQYDPSTSGIKLFVLADSLESKKSPRWFATVRTGDIMRTMDGHDEVFIGTCPVYTGYDYHVFELVKQKP